jgi:hypothetical protein
MTKTQAVEIYIQLLGDEEGTLRPTQGAPVGKDLYRVLPIPNYDIADEEWEFTPGTTVRCEARTYRNQGYLLAVEKVG